MKTYHILIGNGEALFNDFLEKLFREVCQGTAAVKFHRTSWASDFIQQASQGDFDLIIQVPHNLFQPSAPHTPMGWIGEAIHAIRAMKSKRPVPLIAIVGLKERARYEPLLLEAGADCVLELPFEGEELRSAVGRLLRLPAPPVQPAPGHWFFAGVLVRGLRRLSQA